jgi:hypothetical protein
MLLELKPDVAEKDKELAKKMKLSMIYSNVMK